MSEKNDALAEVEELVWALLDEYATDAQIRRLEELLLADKEARLVYLTCVRIHSELQRQLGGIPCEVAGGL
jgi:hypothetical protein